MFSNVFHESQKPPLLRNQVEKRIREQEDDFSSEDEEMLFYDAEKLEAAYQMYTAATSGTDDVSCK